MKSQMTYTGGESFNLRDVLLQGRKMSFQERLGFFSGFMEDLVSRHESLYMREALSAADREVEILDPVTGERKKMLMFGSNNYLGLANHPEVCRKVREAIGEYGVGIGGPPLLNGYTRLHRELEERLSAFKGTEDTLIFSTGFGANLGLLSGLAGPHDTVLYDDYSHASFCDGLKLCGAKAIRFGHNDVAGLAALLDKQSAAARGDMFVGVEGVYSMDGDLAPLDKIAQLCRRHGAFLLVDDAHGTGILGDRGSGTVEHFGLDGQVAAIMGTFSKTFSVVGGFVSAAKPIIQYLRFLARSYMFSASLPPVVVAAVLAGLEVIEKQPELRQRLHANVGYLAAGLRHLGLEVHPQAAIIALRVPEGINIRRAALQFHQAGLFVNSVEYPAVPINQQRFRLSLMATHTQADLDRLLSCIEKIWASFPQTDLRAA